MSCMLQHRGLTVILMCKLQYGLPGAQNGMCERAMKLERPNWALEHACHHICGQAGGKKL